MVFESRLKRLRPDPAPALLPFACAIALQAHQPETLEADMSNADMMNGKYWKSETMNEVKNAVNRHVEVTEAASGAGPVPCYTQHLKAGMDWDAFVSCVGTMHA